jgi:hypothetical protein
MPTKEMGSPDKFAAFAVGLIVGSGMSWNKIFARILLLPRTGSCWIFIQPR